MPAAAHVAIAAIIAAGARAASAHVPGAICAGVDPNGPAEDMLRAKHLKIFDFEWGGYARKDASAPKGWVG